jgi:urease accessory protein
MDVHTPLDVIGAPLGNLASFDLRGRTLERVPIESDDLAKRVLRLQAARRTFGIRFEDGKRLRDGDVVYADEVCVVAVEVLPDDVLVCAPQSIPAALELAHAIGNRHLEMQVHGDRLVLRYERLVEDLVREQGVPYTREHRRLSTPFRHAHAPHGHE